MRRGLGFDQIGHLDEAVLVVDLQAAFRAEGEDNPVHELVTVAGRNGHPAAVVHRMFVCTPKRHIVRFALRLGATAVLIWACSLPAGPPSPPTAREPRT